MGKLKRDYPNERPDQRWERIYAEVIPVNAEMSEVEQKDARETLRERVGGFAMCKGWE
jgi:hypothetical protein